MFYYLHIPMKTRIKMYIGRNPHVTSTTVMPLYKLQVKKWKLLPWKTIADWMNYEEALRISRMIERWWIPEETEKDWPQFYRKKDDKNSTLEYMLTEHYIKWERQIDIAKKIGISQAKVSNTLNRRIREQIRKEFPTKPSQSSLLS